VVCDGVTAEHADESPVVPHADVHDDEPVVPSQQHVEPIGSQGPRSGPAVLDKVPRHRASPVARGRCCAARRKVGTVEMQRRALQYLGAGAASVIL